MGVLRQGFPPPQHEGAVGGVGASRVPSLAADAKPHRSIQGPSISRVVQLAGCGQWVWDSDWAGGRARGIKYRLRGSRVWKQGVREMGEYGNTYHLLMDR